MSYTRLTCSAVVLACIIGGLIGVTTRRSLSANVLQSSVIDELVNKLLLATSDKDLEKLLAENQQLVTPELVTTLLKREEAARNQRKTAEAQSLVRIALTVATRLGDESLIGSVLVEQAILTNSTGDSDSAFKLLDAAEDHGKKAGSPQLVSRVQNARVDFYLGKGALVEAYEAAKREVAMAPKDAPVLQGDAHYHLGRTRDALALYQDAFTAYRDAEDAYRRSGRADKRVVVLNSLAIAHSRSGRPDRAVETYDEILAALGQQSESNRLRFVKTLSNKGLDLSYTGRPVEGLKALEEAITLLREDDDDQIRVSVYLNKSIAHAKAGNNLLALEAIKMAHKISQESKRPVPFNYVRLEWSRLLLSKETVTEDDIRQAVELAEVAFNATDPADLESLWLAHVGKANAYIAAKRKPEALAALTKATEVIDSILQSIGDDPEAIAAYLSDKSDIYEGVASLSVQVGKTSEALFALEKGRARGLLNVIERGAPQPRQAMNPADREREAIAKARLAQANQAMLAADQDPNVTKSTKDELAVNLTRARTNWANLRLELAKNYPGLNRTSHQVSALSEGELKDLLSDADTAILEYILNDEDAIGFVITNDGGRKVHSFPLKGGPKTIATKVADYHTIVSSGQGGYTQLGKDLYDALVAPADAHIKTKSRLIIVPSGQLWRIPFHALVRPDGQFLIQKHAFSYVQSLSVLRELRRKSPQATSTTTELVALANPTVSSNPAGASNAVVKRDSVVLMGKVLEPLLKIEEQATRFVNQLGRKRAQLYPRARATEEMFRNAATQAGAIYFAAHGIVNNEAPLYSRIVLASSGKDTHNDGVVEAWEVLEMKVPATLVILAACDSAGGQVKAGEGMIGLSWAFAVAGSPRLIASQWSVPESSTALLMDEMMRQIFGLSRDGRGMRRRATPDVALQEAAKLLIKNPETRDPWHWAGFEVIGDSRQW